MPSPEEHQRRLNEIYADTLASHVNDKASRAAESDQPFTAFWSPSVGMQATEIRRLQKLQRQSPTELKSVVDTVLSKYPEANQKNIRYAISTLLDLNTYEDHGHKSYKLYKSGSGEEF